MTLLRSALFNLFFFAATAVLVVYGLALRALAPRRVVGVPVLWARVQLAAARAICGIGFAVTGREHLPAGPALIASQHQSAFDTMVWFLLLPNCSYVLKRELTRIPAFGWLIRPAGMVVVDRKAGAKAIRSLLRDVAAAASAGKQVVIFPEGTRAEPGRPLPIQPGVAALAAAVPCPVLPVATDSGRYWGRRAFRKRPGTIRIAIHPPLPQGMPRAVLTARLEAIYRAGPGDNSVGESPAPLAAEARPARETLESS